MIKILNIIGLIFNTVAAIILISPNIKRTRNVDDDYITFMNKETGDYTQYKHVGEQRINIIALSFLAVGFLLQLIAVLL